MNQKSFRYLAILLTVTAVLAGILVATAGAQGNPKASGHGNLTVGDFGQTRTFTFTAVQHADGTVTGQFEVNNPSFPIRVHGQIDCLKFDGNRAIASGPATQTTEPGVVALGRIAVFGVEDNGEGNNALPDQITTIPDYDPAAGIDCQDFSFNGDNLMLNGVGFVRSLRAIEAGNIQVKP
jgi:hypothetical protein